MVAAVRERKPRKTANAAYRLFQVIRRYGVHLTVSPGPEPFRLDRIVLPPDIARRWYGEGCSGWTQ